MHARATKPIAFLSAFLLLAGVGLAACGDDDGGSASDDTTTTVPGAEESEVTIVAKDFSLTSVTAKPGEEVYVSNTGDKTHTVTSDDDGAFDTGNVKAGSEAEFDAPNEPGTYAFHCSIHASMTGTLTVEA